MNNKLGNIENNNMTVHIPMKFKRKNCRKEIVVKTDINGHPAPKSRYIQDAMVIAISRAHRWKELLESGQYSTITELASDIGVDGSYVGRILRLTLLAPDIVESILEGNEPDGLSLEKLVKGFPMEWEQQKASLALFII